MSRSRPHIPIPNDSVSFPVLFVSSIVTRDSRMADAEGEEVVLTVTDVSCVPEVGCYTYFELMFTHKRVRTSLAEPDSHTKSGRDSGDTRIMSWC